MTFILIYIYRGVIKNHLKSTEVHQQKFNQQNTFEKYVLI